MSTLLHSPVVVFLSNLYQLPLPTPPKFFLPAFCRNHKASCTTIGSKPFHPAPLAEKRPVRVLAGESEATVGPPEQILLLVVNEGGIAPALPATLHLEVVEEAGVHPPLLGLGAFPEPSHARIVR